MLFIVKHASNSSTPVLLYLLCLFLWVSYFCFVCYYGLGCLLCFVVCLVLSFGCVPMLSCCCYKLLLFMFVMVVCVCVVLVMCCVVLLVFDSVAIGL